MNTPIDNQTMTAFWIVMGSLVLSNAGLIFNAVYSHFKRLNKMRVDIDAAHKEIRKLKQITKE